MSDKEMANAQRLDDLPPGPWTAFNPLNAGWAITSPSGTPGFAYARYRPDDNSVELLFSVYTTGAAGVPVSSEAADGYGWANMPAADPLGNPLLPPQLGEVLVGTDRIQSTTPGTPRIHVNPGGAITLFGISTASTFMRCHCGRYTMDDLGLA